MSRMKWDYVPTAESAASPECLGCSVEAPVNEARIWCPTAASEQRWCQMRKTFSSVQFKKPWAEHYNIAAGKVIRSERELKETFKAQSAAASERMGFDVNLQIADPTDTKTLGVNEKGLDATHDAKVASGERESRGKFVF